MALSRRALLFTSIAALLPGCVAAPAMAAREQRVLDGEALQSFWKAVHSAVRENLATGPGNLGVVESAIKSWMSQEGVSFPMRFVRDRLPASIGLSDKVELTMLGLHTSDAGGRRLLQLAWQSADFEGGALQFHHLCTEWVN